MSSSTGFCPFLLTGRPSYRGPMSYRVTFVDDRVESIAGADAYLQEGPLTTFFRTSPRRGVIDS